MFSISSRGQMKLANRHSKWEDKSSLRDAGQTKDRQRAVWNRVETGANWLGVDSAGSREYGLPKNNNLGQLQAHIEKQSNKD